MGSDSSRKGDNPSVKRQRIAELVVTHLAVLPGIEMPHDLQHILSRIEHINKGHDPVISLEIYYLNIVVCPYMHTL